jgi:uncharacterized protein (DUF362 family)
MLEKPEEQMTSTADKPGGNGRMPAYHHESSRVAVQALAKGSNDSQIMAAAKRVAEAATDFSWLSLGDSVLLKPASNSGKDYPATTSPLAVRATVALLKEKGAGRIVLAEKPGVEWVLHTRDKQKGSSRECLTKNGLHAAAIESGAEIHYFEEAGYDAYFGVRPVTANHWKGDLFLPNILNEIDHVIVLPRVSRHVLAGSSLGLKAAVGWLRDDSRLELHRDGRTFYDKIAEINQAAVLREKVRLYLTVATKVQTTIGPDMGYKTEPAPGLVIGSESVLTHDMIALGWLLWNTEKLTPGFRRIGLMDGYAWFPGAINRGFVGYVWGIRELVNSESYSKADITSVRKDPVMARAAALMGGFPEVELEDVVGNLPPDIRAYLMEKART